MKGRGWRGKRYRWMSIPKVAKAMKNQRAKETKLMSWWVSPVSIMNTTKGYWGNKQSCGHAAVVCIQIWVYWFRSGLTGVLLLPFYQQQHCRQRCLSADVNHGEDYGPVALSGPHKQHPEAQTPKLPSINERHSARSSVTRELAYLGDTKKPPLSAPRQDRATKMGTRDAKPCRARLANVCR